MGKITTETVMSVSPRILQCLQGASPELVVQASEWREREGCTSVVHFRDLNPEELRVADATLFLHIVENTAKTASLNGAAEHKRIT